MNSCFFYRGISVKLFLVIITLFHAGKQGIPFIKAVFGSPFDNKSHFLYDAIPFIF
jgi:hypothetical protein